MNCEIPCGHRKGTVQVPSSKSMMHRFLIAAALSRNSSCISCNGISNDVIATINCLRSLGSKIEIIDGKNMKISPIDGVTNALLECGESGSTLRFLLPVAGALGYHTEFHMSEGLAKRPTDALIQVMSSHGVKITKNPDEYIITGRLTAGDYRITGSISSQYISGLLFALPLLDGTSKLEIADNAESSDYILMTEAVLKNAGISFKKENNIYIIPGNQKYHSQDITSVSADWSNAAFFLCMGALSENGVTVSGLSFPSVQGDSKILEILKRFGAWVYTGENTVTVHRGKLIGQKIDASAIPDLVPTICALAACAEGTTEIDNAGRLRYKESDRLKTTHDMLASLGADITIADDGLMIHGKPYLEGGTINAANDHRIAMAAAVAACSCRNNVCVLGAECVDKSYPDFWKHLESLEVLK